MLLFFEGQSLFFREYHECSDPKIQVRRKNGRH